MTNHEYLKQMPTDEFADWLCKQVWEDYRNRNEIAIDMVRFHQIRKFLLMEYKESKNETAAGTEKD